MRTDYLGCDIEWMLVHGQSIGFLYHESQEALDPYLDASSYAASMAFDVAKWMKDARSSRGWRQDDIAEKLSTTKGNVSHWETGKHEPSPAQVIAVRDFTGYPLPPMPGESRVSLTKLLREEPGKYAVKHQLQPDELADQFGVLLATIPGEKREAAAAALKGWAREGGAEHWKRMFLAALIPGKRQSTGT